MKRKLSIVIAAVMVVSAFAGCSTKNDSSGAKSSGASSASVGDAKNEDDKTASEGDSYVIKLAHGAAEGVALHKGAVAFKEEVEKNSDGRITVEIYPNQMLGGDREYTEAVQMGNIEMGMPSCTPVANFVSQLYIFDTPFAFSSREHAFEILDGDVGRQIMATLSTIGIKGLGCWENGFRNLTCNDEAKTTPEQLRGLKIRTMENDIHMEIWKSLGANPTPMAFGELYTALQQKTIDAQENPMELIYNTRFYEVQDYVIESKHIFTPYLVLINEAFFDSRTPEDQEIILNAYDAATIVQREVAATGEIDCANKISEYCEIVAFTEAERDVFIDRTSHVRDMVKEKCGDAELADAFFAAVSE